MAAPVSRLGFVACCKRHQLLAGAECDAGSAGRGHAGSFRRSARDFARQPVERGGDYLFLRRNPEVAWLAEFARATFSQTSPRPEDTRVARASTRQSDFRPIQESPPERGRQRFFDASALAPT